MQDANQLSGELAKVADRTGLVYVVVYQPKNLTKPGTFHALKVKVNVAGARVSARSGYYEPRPYTALSPIEKLEGIITPSSLHNDRSHSGTPDIDPKQHRLLLHGMVARPLSFTVDALLSYPMTSRIHFLECAGNSNRNLAPQPAQIPDVSSAVPTIVPPHRARPTLR